MVISIILVYHSPPNPALGGSVALNLLFLNVIVAVTVYFICLALYTGKVKIWDSQQEFAHGLIW